jgi:choline kinase
MEQTNKNDKLVGYILAAGYSKRIKGITKDKPKPLLEINGKKIISYHLDALAKANIKDTHIVVGFLKDLVKKTIGNEHKGMNIHYIENNEYRTTGHSYSMYLGKELFKKYSILLIHADVFCDPLLLGDVINSDFENVSLIDENYKILTGDEFVIVGENNIINQLGPNKIGNIQGEFLGLSKLSSEFLTPFCNYMEDFFIKKGKNFNYEIVMDEFLKDNPLILNYQKIGNKRWININYLEDYHKAIDIANEICI